MRTKYFYIHTFGCQMNVHDSEQLAEMLKARGYQKADSVETSDLVIINTCCVREKAEQKAFSMMGRLRRLKRDNPGLILCVVGCMAQQRGRDILKRVPYLDIVVGTHNLHHLPRMISEVEGGRKGVTEIGFHESIASMDVISLPGDNGVTAFVSIMQGCDNFCAYCIVPYVRGREMSRESSDIIREIETLAAHGVKEVTLLGQNVNSFGKNLSGGQHFPALLERIGEIPGIERIRFTTSHPKDLSDHLIRCFTTIGTLCEHIHLPVQSGSDAILRRMKRGYRAGDYLERVERLREACPGISITSDIIVGFPGESDGEFQKTIDLMGKVRFDNTFSFVYSDRPGTAAEGYDRKVERQVQIERLTVLQSLQAGHTEEKNRKMHGTAAEILIEGFSKNERTDLMGRTRTNTIVNVRGNRDLIGNLEMVKITETYMHSVRGELLAKKEALTC